MIRLFGLSQVTEDYVVREAKQIKKTRQSQEKELARLHRQRDQLRRLEGMGERVGGVLCGGWRAG